MTFTRAALALFALLLGAAAQAHAEPVTDVTGRPVPFGSGRPTLVFYANPTSGDALEKHALELAYRLRSERPIVVVRVDLRDVPWFMHGFASGKIRKAQQTAFESMRAVFRNHGDTPPPELETSLFMVADEDGSPHKALGLSPDGTPYARAFGPSGVELARGAFPARASAFECALRGTTPQSASR